MELKQFVKSVIKDVISGVEEAKTEAGRVVRLDNLKEQRTIEFDIAVTVEDATSATGKAGVKVFSIIEGGGETVKAFKNASVSRIKFGIWIDPWGRTDEQTNASYEASPDLSPY